MSLLWSFFFFFKVTLQFKVQQNKITVLKRKITDLILKTRYRRSESDLILVTPEKIWSYCILITSDVVEYDWNQDPTSSGINKGRNCLYYDLNTVKGEKKKKKKLHKPKGYISTTQSSVKSWCLTQAQVLSANVKRGTTTQFCLLNKFLIWNYSKDVQDVLEENSGWKEHVKLLIMLFLAMLVCISSGERTNRQEVREVF